MLATIRKVEGDTYIPASCRAATLFPVLAYDEDQKLFICDDQTVGFGFICQPLNGADEKIQDRVNGFMTQDYPKNTIAQFFSFRSPDISQEIYKILGLRDGFRHEILSATIQERAEFLKKHTRERITATNDRGIYDNGIVHDQKLIISFKIPISGRFPTEKEYLELKQIRTKCEASIQSIGVAPHAMTSAQYKRVMGTILNWGTDASWKHENDNLDQDKAICDQLLDFDTQIDVYKNKLVIGDYHVKVLSAKKTPDKMFFGDALAYIGDLAGTDSGVKENYFICMNVFYPDHESEKRNLNASGNSR
jgi:conjugal transfer ATP-binding protein TraC